MKYLSIITHTLAKFNRLTLGISSTNPGYTHSKSNYTKKNEKMHKWKPSLHVFKNFLCSQACWVQLGSAGQLKIYPA